jgi:hypothetical protein
LFVHLSVCFSIRHTCGCGCSIICNSTSILPILLKDWIIKCLKAYWKCTPPIISRVLLLHFMLDFVFSYQWMWLFKACIFCALCHSNFFLKYNSNFEQCLHYINDAHSYVAHRDGLDLVRGRGLDHSTWRRTVEEEER